MKPDKIATVFWSQTMGTDKSGTSSGRKVGAKPPSLSAALGDSLRDGSDFCILKTGSFFAVLDAADFDCAAAADFVGHIDAVTAAARLLKNGNTCFVTVIDRNGRRYVIKRYNPKGFLHSLRHTLKRSRARRSWLNAHRLLYLGIPTPRPVGFIEEYAGCLIKRSWLITELAPGPKLKDYLADPDISKSPKTVVIDRVFDILERLEQHRITHGDLKHVNLIVTPDGPTLLDLDSLKIHRTGLFYWYHRKKDLNAFDFTALK